MCLCLYQCNLLKGVDDNKFVIITFAAMWKKTQMTQINLYKWFRLNFDMVILSFASTFMMFVECTTYSRIKLVMRSIVLSGFIMSFVKDVKFEWLWHNKLKLIVEFAT